MKTTRKVWTSFTKPVKDGFKTTQKSQAIPDRAPSLREMLVRHMNGIIDNVSMNVSYSGDLPDLRGYEPHELDAMILDARQNLTALEELVHQEALASREEAKRKKKEYDLELLRELKMQENG